MAHPKPSRVAIVVHPTRPIDQPLAVLQAWADDNALDIVQVLGAGDVMREMAPRGELQGGDLVVALGGDGTVLSAMRASAPVDAPVLAVACGSLGVLTAVAGSDIGAALDRVMTGDWTARELPALGIQTGDAPYEWAINDFVAVRHGAGQLVANVTVDDGLYVRLAGDGLIVSTALGSSAYSMAAGGPLLVSTTPAFVCTPLAMHGGNAPPLVVPSTSTVRVELHPSFAGFEIEIDGHNYPVTAHDFNIALKEDQVTLIALDGLGLGLTGLRERGLITDSPRVLARDKRAPG